MKFQDQLRQARNVCATASLVLILSACSTPPGGIFKLFDLDNGSSLSTGSRQRLVINTSPKAMPRPGLVQPTRIVCAEPSPDVAATVANSGSFGLSIFGQGSGSLSGSQVEGVIQLAERTATIQLLRDQMYRACEAYANGAISGTTYSLITSKNNKTMVSLLLGETAGGGVGRSLGGTGTKASSAAKAATLGLEKNSAAAKKAAEDLEKADADLTIAKTEQARLEAEKKPADEITEAKKVVAIAQAKRDDAALRLQSSSQASSNSAAEVNNLIVGGEIDINESAELASQLKEIQGQFLEANFLEDFVSVCLVEMGLNHKPTESSILAFKSAEKRLNNAAVTLARDPTNIGHLDNYHRAADRFDTSVLRENNSYLSRICKDELPRLLAGTRVDRFKIRIKELDVELASVKANSIVGLSMALAQCQARKTDKQKEECRKAALSLSTGKSINSDVTVKKEPTIPIEVEDLTEAIRPMDAYSTLQDVGAHFSIKLLILKKEVNKLVIPAVGTHYQTLVAKRTELLKSTGLVKASFKDNVNSAKATSANELQGKHAEIVATLDATDVNDSDGRQSLKNKLAIQQAESKQLSNTLENITRDIGTLLPEVDKYKTSLKEYDDKNKKE